MKIRLVREPTAGGTTHGVMFVDGAYFGFTLEDAVREVADQPVSAWKVPGVTAIPAGTYPVTITLSQRFGRLLPLLEGVSGFTGIRIHAGNIPAHTEGCILVGFSRDHGSIGQSRQACDRLQAQIDLALSRQEPVTIEIENPV